MFCADTTPKFDIPFLARRMIINNIAIPDKLNLFGKNSAFDTLELWKFGDYKHVLEINV
jgi:hypothetical protein